MIIITQVRLGILLKNENEDMIDNMKHHQQYTPTVEKSSTYIHDENVTMTKHFFHRILFGGDQITCARARGSQRHRVNSDTELERLQGLLPVNEDWHTKMCFLGVCECTNIFYLIYL